MTLRELDAINARDFQRADAVGRLTLVELYRELREITDNLEGHSHEGLSRCYHWEERTTPHMDGETARRGFPRLTDTTRLNEVRYRWIAVFPVTGSNEGHYVHVDLLWQVGIDEGRVPLFLLKTFGGHAEAVQLAGLIGRVLGV